jgi:anti-sigma B factor antagonist
MVREMSSFAVTPEPVVDEAHAWLLTVTGELDVHTVVAFADAVADVIARGARLVTLDLSAVTFLDSSGLRGIIHASHDVAARDGHLTVAGLSGAAQRVLELTGLLEQLRESPPATAEHDPG